MDYVKGVFMKRKAGKYGEYFILSVTDEGLANLKALEANKDGFRAVIASPRKETPDKYSIKPFPKKEDSAFTPGNDLPF
jgi:hypothetical protein